MKQCEMLVQCSRKVTKTESKAPPNVFNMGFKPWLCWHLSLFPQFLFDAFISLIQKGKDANIVSVMPKKPYIPPRAQVQYVSRFT